MRSSPSTMAIRSTAPMPPSRPSGEAPVPPTNALALDAMTAHWEPAWGPTHFKALARRLDYPVLAINCFDQKTGRRPFTASRAIERGGLQIGVIGAAPPSSIRPASPHFSEVLALHQWRQRSCRARSAGFASKEQGRYDSRPLPISACRRTVRSFSAPPPRAGRRIDVILSGYAHDRLERPVIANGATSSSSPDATAPSSDVWI